MIEELRTFIEYPSAGSRDSTIISGWLSVRINDDYSIDVYVESDQSGDLNALEEAERFFANDTEFLFRVCCKDMVEAKKTAHSITDFITKPGLISMDLDDVRTIASIGNREAKLRLFESFDNEPIEEFMKRIKMDLGLITSRNIILQAEGNIGLIHVYDFVALVTELSSEEANIMFSSNYDETLGYKAFYVFTF